MHIGVPDYAAFAPDSPDFLALSPRAVASLDLASGTVLWRRILPQFIDNAEGLWRRKSLALAISSGEEAGTRTVYTTLWNTLDGSLLWDYKFTKEGEYVGCLMLSPSSTGDMRGAILLRSRDSLTALSIKDGVELWKWQAAAGEEILDIVENESASTISILTRHKGTGTAFLRALRSKDGAASKKINGEVDGSAAALVGDKVIFLSPSLSGSLHSRDVKVVNAVFALSQAHTTRENGFTVFLNEKTSLMRSVLVGELEGKCFVISASDDHAPSVLEIPYNSCRLARVRGDVLDLGFSDKVVNLDALHLHEDDIAFDHSAGVSRLFLHDGFLLSVTKTDEIQGVEWSRDASQLLWTRDESFSKIVFADFVDFPSIVGEHESASLNDAVSDLATGLTDTAISVGESVHRSLQDIGVSIPALSEALQRHAVSSKSSTRSDRFGYKQAIIVATRCGNVAALSTVDGSVLWKVYLGEVEIVSMISYRAAAHISATIVLAYHSVNGPKQPLVAVLSSLDGKLLPQNSPHSNDIVRLLHTSVPTENENVVNSAVLAVDKDMSMHLLPMAADPGTITALDNSIAKVMYSHHIDVDSSTISGYSFGLQSSVKLTPAPLWKIKFTAGLGKTERIAQVLTSDASIVNPHFPVPPKHFDASGEYDAYMNPNLIFVGTFAPVDIPDGSLSGYESLNIYVIDALTGNVIYHTFHQYASGPLHMVREQNWLVYHFRNSRHHRYEIGSIELYSQPATPLRPSVFALAQGYIVDFDVTAASVSKTLYSFTSKQVLFASSSGRIFGINHQFTSARRPDPENITNTHREQLLLPYSMQLHPGPANLVSSNYTVEGITAIRTAPTYVESSSLVFAFGHDMFFTVTTPSKAFDIMDSDFNYPALVFTVLAVIGATLTLKILAERKELNAMWK